MTHDTAIIAHTAAIITGLGPYFLSANPPNHVVIAAAMAAMTPNTPINVISHPKTSAA